MNDTTMPDDRTQAFIRTLMLQRNSAMDAAADLDAQLQMAQKRIAELEKQIADNAG